MVEVSDSLEQLYNKLKHATTNPQIIDLSMKIIDQAPKNQAALKSCLIGLIRSRQFDEALLFIDKHKLNVDFEHAYILHRMTRNQDALDRCKHL